MYRSYCTYGTYTTSTTAPTLPYGKSSQKKKNKNRISVHHLGAVCVAGLLFLRAGEEEHARSHLSERAGNIFLEED